jgi:hypothetical protein
VDGENGPVVWSEQGRFPSLATGERLRDALGMPYAWWAALLPALLFLDTLGCVPERDDVEPTIVSIALATQGAGDLAGEVRVRYENLGEDTLVIERPELQLMRADRTVTAIDLGFPAGFDTSFESGASREAVFSVADSGGWSSWCGQTVDAEIHHRCVASDGSVSTSLGPAAPVGIGCQQ